MDTGNRSRAAEAGFFCWPEANPVSAAIANKVAAINSRMRFIAQWLYLRVSDKKERRQPANHIHISSLIVARGPD